MQKTVIRCESCKKKFVHINPRKRNIPKRFCDECLKERAKHYNYSKYHAK